MPNKGQSSPGLPVPDSNSANSPKMPVPSLPGTTTTGSVSALPDASSKVDDNKGQALSSANVMSPATAKPVPSPALPGSNTATSSVYVPAVTPPSTANHSSPTTTTSARSQAEETKLALSLGSVLMELRGRVMEARLLGSDNVVPNDKMPSVGFAIASNWRGLYSRAVILHLELLGDQEVDLVRYNMAVDRPAYLNARVPYISIGLADSNLKFAIAEKLRQVLNFLTCLYQKLDTYEQVIEELFSDTASGLTKELITAEVPATTAYNYLIDKLSLQVEALITAWDSYIRERLQAESLTMLAARYGYEAGRLINDLTWSLTVKTTPYRKSVLKDKFLGHEAENAQAMYAIWCEMFNPSRIVQIQRQVGGLMGVLEQEYLENGRKTASKPADNESLEAEQARLEDFDLKSPRAAINAVVQSLDYWQRTVLEISENGLLQPANAPNPANKAANRQPPSWNQNLKLHPSWGYDQMMDMRTAFSEQATIWFSLIAGRQDLTSFRVVNIASDLVQDYSQRITKLASRNLQDAFKQLQQEFTELAATGVKATTEVAKAGVSALTNFFTNKWVLIGGAVAVVFVIVAALLLAIVAQVGGGGIVASLITPILAAVGIGPGVSKALADGKERIGSAESAGTTAVVDKSAQSQRVMSEKANVGALILSAAGELRAYLEQAFTKGFSQLQRELSLTSATLAVTSPLVEFVVRFCDPNNELEFLGSIIWNDSVRKNQLNRIVIAAFGPVGAFLISSAEEGENTSPDNSAKSAQTVTAKV